VFSLEPVKCAAGESNALSNVVIRPLTPRFSKIGPGNVDEANEMADVDFNEYGYLLGEGGRTKGWFSGTEGNASNKSTSNIDEFAQCEAEDVHDFRFALF